MDSDRLVSQGRKSNAMSQTLLRVVHIIVIDCCVGRDSIIPQGNSALFPTHAGLEVLSESDVLDDVSSYFGRVSWTGLLTLKRRSSRASDSSFLNPTILFVKPGLIKRTF